MLMHTNENYLVTADTDKGLYDVVNRRSGIVEYSNTALPKCIIAADEWNRVIIQSQPKESTTGELIPFKPR